MENKGKIAAYVLTVFIVLGLLIVTYYIGIRIAAKYYAGHKPADKVSVQPKAPIMVPDDVSSLAPPPIVEKKSAAKVSKKNPAKDKKSPDQIKVPIPVPKIDLSACKLANVKVKQGKSGKAILRFDCPVVLKYFE